MDQMVKDFKVSCTNCSLDEICLPRGLSQQEVENLSIEVRNNISLQKVIIFTVKEMNLT